MLPTIQASSVSINQVVNTSATLFCLVSGYPLPTISWVKDGVVVIGDSSITITTQSATGVSNLKVLKQLNTTFTGDVGVVSLLRISSLKRKDNGNYVCRAMNSFMETGSFSTSTSTISILVFGENLKNFEYCSKFISADVPEAPGTPSFNHTAVSVYLQWSPPGFIGNNAILGYQVYQRMVHSQSSLKLLPGPGQYTTTSTMINITVGIVPSTTYEFAVEACNKIGCSNRLVYSPFRTGSLSAGEVIVTYLLK